MKTLCSWSRLAEFKLFPGANAKKESFKMRTLLSLPIRAAQAILCAVLLLVATPQAARTQTAAALPQASDQDCAKIKQDIEQLQQDLASLSVEVQRLTNMLNNINKDISKAQANLKLTTASGLNETLRGELLDSLGSLMNFRSKWEKQIEDDTSLMQAIKDEIADLLNKLAKCAPPSTTEPPNGQTGALTPSGGAPSSPPTQSGVPTTPSGATPVQQTAGQDCATIKQDIQQLQQDLANLSVEVQRLTDMLNNINKDISKAQANLKLTTASGLNQTLRGELLDSLGGLMSFRSKWEKQLEDDTDLMRAIKDEIADLLGKLANCMPPSTTEPAKREPPAEQPAPPPSKPTPSKSQTSMSTTGAGIQFQLRGFGGATVINGNTPSTSGFDGAVLFPLGNRVLVGPTAGFQWVDSSIVKTIGGGPPPSTFIHESVGFKNGNFGGEVVILPFVSAGQTYSAFTLGDLSIGIRGGATVAGSTITQASGFCGNGTPTGGPAGCTTTSTTTTHDTVTGPFVGGYISHSIFSHVGVFVGYDYSRLKITGPSSGSSGASSTLNLHSNSVVAGVVLSFGRHHAAR
jgi:hypothetical protein